MSREITKETFYQFLRNNDFFEECPQHLWLYSGISALAMSASWPSIGYESLRARFDGWRKAHQSDYINLDEKWIGFVNKKMIIELWTE